MDERWIMDEPTLVSPTYKRALFVSCCTFSANSGTHEYPEISFKYYRYRIIFLEEKNIYICIYNIYSHQFQYYNNKKRKRKDIKVGINQEQHWPNADSRRCREKVRHITVPLWYSVGKETRRENNHELLYDNESKL